VDTQPPARVDDDREVVLRARCSTEDADACTYTTRPVMESAGKRRSPSSSFQLQYVADNVIVTSMTFAKPFAHSTSTWVAGDDDETAARCHIMISIFSTFEDVLKITYSKQRRHYGIQHMQSAGGRQSVTTLRCRNCWLNVGV